MFDTKPALRINAHLFPVVGGIKLSAAASNRGTDDPIITLTPRGVGKFPASTLTFIRYTGTSGSAAQHFANPELVRGLDTEPVIDESVGSGTIYKYQCISTWAKCCKGYLAIASVLFGLSNVLTLTAPTGKKPVSPISGLGSLTYTDYPDLTKARVGLTIVNGNQIQVTWNDVTTVETGFSLERSTDGGATWPVAYPIGPKSSTGLVTYTDTAVVAGVVYTYRVKATRSDSLKDSAYTYPASISF